MSKLLPRISVPRLLISMEQDLVSEPGHLQGIWGYFSLISVVPARVTIVTFLLRNYNSSGVCLASSVHFSPEDTQLLAFSDYFVCAYDWPCVSVFSAGWH